MVELSRCFRYNILPIANNSDPSSKPAFSWSIGQSLVPASATPAFCNASTSSRACCGEGWKRWGERRERGRWRKRWKGSGGRRGRPGRTGKASSVSPTHRGDQTFLQGLHIFQHLLCHSFLSCCAPPGLGSGYAQRFGGWHLLTVRNLLMLMKTVFVFVCSWL